METDEVTGRIDLGACPSSMALAFDLVWLALPGLGTIVAVDPETGAIVAEGTSGLHPMQWSSTPTPSTPPNWCSSTARATKP